MGVPEDEIISKIYASEAKKAAKKQVQSGLAENDDENQYDAEVREVTNENVAKSASKVSVGFRASGSKSVVN